jgi:Low temperature viability protein
MTPNPPPESSNMFLHQTQRSHSPSLTSFQTLIAQTISRETLENDIDVENIRENEGEAAEYGIFFDDTEYDYMQHLRTVGETPDAVLLEAPSQKDKEKGKSKEIVFGEKVPCSPWILGLIIAWNSKGSSRFSGGN